MAKHEASFKQKFARLEALAQQTGAAIYERVKIAHEIMSDKTYLDERYEGDDLKCAEEIQEKYFADIGGLMSVYHLVEVFRAYPTEEVWKKNRYNLKAMRAQWLEDHPEPKNEGHASRRSVTLKDLQVKEEQIEELSCAVKRNEKAAERMEDELTKLREENRKLREENAHLKGQLAQAEKGGRLGAFAGN